MQFDASVFKAYDIRGIYQKNLDEELVNRVGRAFAQLIRSESQKENPSVVVSRDMRLSSPQLHQALVTGITDMGLNVIDIGLASTPTLYFASGYLDVDGGIQITASHNPAEWNGFKMVRAKGIPISGDTGIYQIRDMVIANNFSVAAKRGTIVEKSNIIDELILEQTRDFNLDQIAPFKIVVDAANAMGSLDMKALFAKLPCSLIELNFNLDGSFPAHEADPLKDENNEQLKAKIIETKADLGITTDGDGDRIFFVDNLGQTVAPEIVRGILAQMVLRNHPNAQIGYDIRPGKITQDLIIEAGGKPFVTKVGHSLIKEAMLKVDSPFSGESSGHFFYKTPFGSFESPVMVAVNILRWLTEQKTSLANTILPFKRYFHSGEINMVTANKEAVFSKIKSHFGDAKNISELDGILVEYDDFWFNVRGSNTEPKIRLNLEATSNQTMETRRDEVLGIIKSAG